MDRCLFAVMDDASRFDLSDVISPFTQGFESTRLSAAAASWPCRQLGILVSDGLQDFIKAVTKIFGEIRTRDLSTYVRHLCKTCLIMVGICTRLNGNYATGKCARRPKSQNPAVIPSYAHLSYATTFPGWGRVWRTIPLDETIGIGIMPLPDSDMAPVSGRWIPLVQNAAVCTAI